MNPLQDKGFYSLAFYLIKFRVDLDYYEPLNILDNKDYFQ